jgi:gamma-glutamyltranspeptidase
MSEIFLNEKNELVVEGDLIKNSRLAATLEALVKRDNIIYSEDDIARVLVNELNEVKNLDEFSYTLFISLLILNLKRLLI